jgi:hypothetical protein
MMASLIGISTGWTVGWIFWVVVICSVRNLLVLRRL